MPRSRPLLGAVLLAAALALPASAVAQDPTDPAPPADPAPPLIAPAADMPGIPASAATMSFASRPDLKPPAVAINSSRVGQQGQYVFLAPKLGAGQGGPMILDPAGNLVWFRAEPGDQRANDFRVSTFKGRPVLTWWEGFGSNGFGVGTGIVADERYNVIRRVHAGNGLSGDLHEFQLTDRNTALMTVYRPVRRDLRAYGGSKTGYVLDGMIQEIDLDTGAVRFTWHSLDHVPISESVIQAPPPGDPDYYDYFHINSIDVDTDGNLIVSARLTDTVYKISRKTGRIIWRLGGEKSDFKLGPGVRFARQHDARREADGTLSLFDNSAETGRSHSRGLRIALDLQAKTATLAAPVLEDGKFFSSTQGNVQVLPGGNSVVGWGARGRVSEFDPLGNIVFDLRLAQGYDTYRAFRFPWTGRPTRKPLIRVVGKGDGATAAVSWNGATGVASWQLLSGGEKGKLGLAGDPVPTQGFESRIPVARKKIVALRALDAGGNVLATTRPYLVKTGKPA